MATPAIRVQNLVKNYGPVLAVDNISFEVQPGELVGFLGPNGAGKSTSMKILTTYLPASSGYAWLAGYDVMYQSMQVRERIGYLPESVPLYPEMRVVEYLQYRARLKGVARTGRTSRIDYCMEKGRIKEVKNRLLGTLSKGYRQRVGLADTLLADPPILILDEPTSGLDPLQIAETLNTIKELRGQHTVMLSTHILTEVEKVCERVIIINKGRVRFDDTMKAIERREPVHELEVRGPLEGVTKFLQEQAGVVEVLANPVEEAVTAYHVKTLGGKDLREDLGAKLTAKGWPVRRLDLRREGLEQLYFAVVMQKDEPQPQPAPIPAA